MAESLRSQGTAYILAIGVNAYSNPQFNLKYAAPDATTFSQELRQQQLKLNGFSRVEVISLLDKQATRENIMRAFKLFAGDNDGSAPRSAELSKIKRVEPEDSVIIYFAGHGFASNNKFYLVPSNLGYTGQRSQLTQAGLQTILDNSVSDRDLESAFEKIDAGQMLLVIDACNSGQALESEEKRRGPMNSRGLAQLAYEKGMYILTASQSYQVALEAAQLGHGYLTYALVVEGLSQYASDNAPKDGTIEAREWFDYAVNRVPKMQQIQLSPLAAQPPPSKPTPGKPGAKKNRQLEIVNSTAVPAKKPQENLQVPRVFYRRETGGPPLVIARH